MTDSRIKTKNRLKRIAGQIAGLQKMVDDNRYCVDILTQVAAVRSALDSLGVELLTDHMEHCVIDHQHKSSHAEAKFKTQEQLLDEMRLTLSRFLK